MEHLDQRGIGAVAVGHLGEVTLSPDAVDVVVSDGPDVVEVPNVVGQRRIDAGDTLAPYLFVGFVSVLISEVLPPEVPFDYVNKTLNKKALSNTAEMIAINTNQTLPPPRESWLFWFRWGSSLMGACWLGLGTGWCHRAESWACAGQTLASPFNGNRKRKT